MAHISLANVSVRFPLYTSHTRSLRTELFSLLGGQIEQHARSLSVHALDNLSLEISDGDRIGIVGHNGAGKTTLLRVVSGVYEPESGSVATTGSIASFTDITLGMDPESTGWDNIIFRCVFMGLTFAEARKLSPEIAAFSELGDYLDLPVRTYSTGMFVRLAFAISTSINPDIIVMDEMISAGDQNFIRKAQQRIKDLLSNSRILVIASHDPGLLKSTCNKVVWLEKGAVKMIGEPAGVIGAYVGSIRGTP